MTLYIIAAVLVYILIANVAWNLLSIFLNRVINKYNNSYQIDEWETGVGICSAVWPIGLPVFAVMVVFKIIPHIKLGSWWAWNKKVIKQLEIKDAIKQGQNK